MTRKDWTLLVIAAAGGEPVSPVQLQKTLFLLGENLSAAQRRTDVFYHFEPYDYGPFARHVYDDAESLSREGFIVIDPQDGGNRRYRATLAGLQIAEELRHELAASVLQYLDGIVAWARRLRFDQLVRAIYRDYPEMRAKSVFRG